LWEHQHLIEAPPERWFKQHLVCGDRVGYDARLHTPDGIKPLQEAAKRRGVELVAVAENPVDVVWRDRPKPPLGQAELYPEAFAVQSRKSKIQEITAELSRQGVDALVVADPTVLMWLLNLRGTDVPTVPVAFGQAIVRRQGGVLLFMAPEKVGADVRSAFEQDGPGSVLIFSPDELGGELSKFSGLQVLVDPSSVSQWIVDRLEQGGAMVVNAADPCGPLRASKSTALIEGCRAAHRRDALAMVRFLAWFAREAPGQHDEWSVAQVLNGLRAQGEHFRGLSFRTISAAGPNAALPHYSVPEQRGRKLVDGEIYLVDSGAQYLDGTTDVTRVTVMGKPSEEMRQRYTDVLKGHISLGTARFPSGTSGSQLDALARQHLWHVGVDYDHGTGHGVGHFLSVHEGPQNISKRPNRVALKPGMVVSNEPGYYKPGAFGIRIENLVVVQKLEPQPPGAERETLCFDNLTLVPYERRLIDCSRLTASDIAYIDAYHAQVTATLSPNLKEEPATLEWLRQATAPLAQ
jgi:Xaa-Pro aminopeptidase